MELFVRQQEWGVRAEWLQPEEPESGSTTLLIWLQAGRDEVYCRIGPDDARTLLDAGPLRLRALRDYSGFIFGDDLIEVGVSSLSPRRSNDVTFRPLRRLALAGDQSPTDAGVNVLRNRNPWTIRIEGPNGVRVEIGTASPLMRALNYMPTSALSFRVMGYVARRHSEAVEFLEQLKDDLAFELDLTHRVSFSLRRRFDGLPRTPSAGVTVVQATEPLPPRWPSSSYPRQPLALYWYGVSADGMPLLQYLAYYQVLEYYFPKFARGEALAQLKEELLDPRFRASDEEHLSRILQIASVNGGRRGTEVEQLRATIHGCVSEANVESFITETAHRRKNLLEGKILDGLAPLNPSNKTVDIRSQLANRVYDIRCRIVHAKSDGGVTESPVLLPFSKDAEKLNADIQVIRFLAQKVLLAGGRPRTE